ncbi:ABC transporter ATP-binding protein [Halovenus sp. HT40]|uniref:ABC transporter ATP-binding protein n=1 Tax=Halovenus sp. HT40 TaxID=3126691 RepID=UPI00300F7728
MSGQKLDQRVRTNQPAIGWHTDEETTTGETVLELDGLTREYGIETAVEEFSLSVDRGELLTLLGPSGCGKTTTLRMIAGLEQPTGGEVRIAGETVADGSSAVPPEERNVGLVFQEFALFPHLTVGENITFGIDDWESEEQQQRLDELLALVDLDEHRDKYPEALSGGQQQRVALARSLAPEPDILLLDEPFSNLDVRLRIDMRQEVRRILKEAGVTAISVTHDQEEALSISDRVAIMNDGHLEQVGKPELVFENPESRFVASFLGRASFLTGRVRGDTVETELEQLETAQLNGPVDAYDGAQIDILVRPDDLEALPANETMADGEIVHRQYNGPNFVYGVELEGETTLRCLHNHVETFEHGQPVSISITADHELAWYPTE